MRCIEHVNDDALAHVQRGKAHNSIKPDPSMF